MMLVLKMAHDIVILCVDCHVNCKKMATKRMQYMERKCRVDPNTAIPNFVDGKLHKIKSCALALLRWRHKLPPSTVDEYESLIRTHFVLGHLCGDEFTMGNCSPLSMVAIISGHCQGPLPDGSSIQQEVHLNEAAAHSIHFQRL